MSLLRSAYSLAREVGGSWKQTSPRYGTWYAARFTASTINRHFPWRRESTIRRSRSFAFNGFVLPYFCSSFNTTTENERGIEIPIVWHYLKPRLSERVLEVGNVLQHYLLFQHDILDKYEQSPGVLNQDILDFVPAHRYDLILSISTLEHVGWDEERIDLAKGMQALCHLNNLLTERGLLVATIPIGYNPHFDRAALGNNSPFSSCYYFKRVSLANDWVQTSRDAVLGIVYSRPYPNANGLAVGVIDRAADAHR
jgi:hypothetical protein